MKRVLVTLLAACAAAVAAAPASGTHKEPVGEQLNLFGATTAFAAGDAFHVEHGWLSLRLEDTGYDAYGRLEFRLTVDGAPVKASYGDRSWADFNGVWARHNFWVFEFPAGLGAGTHTFVGTWFVPCQVAVDYGQYAGPCAKPTQPVPVQQQTLTVAFS